jgi:hypothetical protein
VGEDKLVNINTFISIASIETIKNEESLAAKLSLIFKSITSPGRANSFDSACREIDSLTNNRAISTLEAEVLRLVISLQVVINAKSALFAMRKIGLLLDRVTTSFSDTNLKKLKDSAERARLQLSIARTKDNPSLNEIANAKLDFDCWEAKCRIAGTILFADVNLPLHFGSHNLVS